MTPAQSPMKRAALAAGRLLSTMIVGAAGSIGALFLLAGLYA